MARLACKECKNEIARNAKVCPHCGALNPFVPAQEPLLELGVLAVILAGSVVSLNEHADASERRSKKGEASTFRHGGASAYPQQQRSAVEPFLGGLYVLFAHPFHSGHS